MRSMHPVLLKQKRLQVASEGGTVEIRVHSTIWPTVWRRYNDLFNGHFPDWYQNVTILDFTWAKDDGNDVKNGAVRRAKLKSNRHHQWTNTQPFTGRMAFLLPNQHSQSIEGRAAHSVKPLRYL